MAGTLPTRRCWTNSLRKSLSIQGSTARRPKMLRKQRILVIVCIMQIHMDGGLRFDWDVHNTDHLAQHDVNQTKPSKSFPVTSWTSTIASPQTVKNAGRPWDQRLPAAFSSSSGRCSTTAPI